MQNYTNIIGKSFFPYVVDQLKKRTELLSNGANGATRTNADLLWLTNRNGWLRITSNIDIKPDTIVAKKYGAGDGLAKKYVLQGGVINADSNTNAGSNLRSGVGLDKAYGVGFKNGDAFGMGLKPMPGVTSFSITADGPYGAMKTANVKIRAYDIEQFNIIETLYCHLGYSCVIEFGHIPYINNEGKLETNIKILDVFNIKNKEQLSQEITKLRKLTCGNYDALFGTLINYSWTSNNDGSYDIDLKIMGPGSVVESLTINYSTSNTNTILNPSTLPIYQEFANKKAEVVAQDPAPVDGTTPPPADAGVQGVQAAQSLEKQLLPGVIASRNNSILHRHLYSLYENALTTQQVTNPADGNGGEGAIRTTTTPTLTTNIFKSNPSYEFLNLSGGSLTGDRYALKGNNSFLISNIDAAKDVPYITGDLFRYFTIAFISNPKQDGAHSAATTKDQLPKVYIPFGYFLAMLQSSGMLYNSSKGDDGGTKTSPFPYLDFNNKTNLCFAQPYAVSVDPNVCLINIADNGKLNDVLFGGTVTGKDGAKILQPTKSQIKADNVYDPAADLLSAKIQSANLGFFNTGNSAFLMNVLLNIEYIVDKLDSLAGSDNDKKEVKLDKFLSEMLGDINNSLGGLNEFRVAFSDESMCIQLTDEQRVEDNTGAIAPAVIDVLGLQSLVQSYSFQSKLTPKIASMLIISAQATEGKNKQASTDASAIGKWNENVKDRIMPAKVDSTDPPTTPAAKVEQPTEATQGQSESPDDQLSRHIKGIYQLFKYSEEDVAAASKTLKEKLTALKANSEETAATGLIPLEMTIKMDGISGILVNQSFVIPPERLPLSYQTDSSSKTKFGFIVRKIENSIENNKWMTSISGQSLYLPKAVDATVKLLNTKITSVKYVTPTPPPSSPAETLDPTAQKKEAEKLSKISVPNSGKNTTANTYTFIPKNTSVVDKALGNSKMVDVFIFYPGVDIGGKVGKDYMPQKVAAAAPDWFDRYVLVFPTTWTTPYSSVKKEYEALLTKAGLTQRTLNIGIYSGSGNNSASVLSALASSGKELRNFIMMDPVPSPALVKAVNSIKSRGGTAQYLYYNPSVWVGESYYGGVDSKGQLFGAIKNLIDAGTGTVGINKTVTSHFDIPTSMLANLKAQIEKYLG